MINPLYAILLIPAVAVVVLVLIPSYRIGAVLNMLASGLTFMAGASLLLVDRYRSDILIVDDFTISGGTLIEMAHACRAWGAKDVYACVSHGVFSGGSAERIARSPLKELVVTDTIGYRFEPLAPCCKVISVAGLFAEAIQSIHRRESVSRLFIF